MKPTLSLMMVTLLAIFSFSLLAQDPPNYHCLNSHLSCAEYKENKNTRPEMPASLKNSCESVSTGKWGEGPCPHKTLGCLLTGHGSSFPFDVSVWFYSLNYNDAYQACALSGGEFVEYKN